MSLGNVIAALGRLVIVVSGPFYHIEPFVDHDEGRAPVDPTTVVVVDMAAPFKRFPCVLSVEAVPAVFSKKGAGEVFHFLKSHCHETHKFFIRNFLRHFSLSAFVFVFDLLHRDRKMFVLKSVAVERHEVSGTRRQTF